MLNKSSYVVGHVMVLYSPDWTNIGFSFVLLTVTLFRHPALIEHGLYHKILEFIITSLYRNRSELQWHGDRIQT